MKRNNLMAEIQSNLKKLSDSQLADVADYIEMIMGVPGDDDFEKDDMKFDDDDYDSLGGDDGYYQDEYDDNLY